VFVTNCGTRAYLLCIPQHLGCDICTFRPVAKIFCDLLFVAVCSHDTGLNRYLRNKGPSVLLFLRMRAVLHK